jgi:hypothetical protein
MMDKAVMAVLVLDTVSAEKHNTMPAAVAVLQRLAEAKAD